MRCVHTACPATACPATVRTGDLAAQLEALAASVISPIVTVLAVLVAFLTLQCAFVEESKEFPTKFPPGVGVPTDRSSCPAVE